MLDAVKYWAVQVAVAGCRTQVIHDARFLQSFPSWPPKLDFFFSFVLQCMDIDSQIDRRTDTRTRAHAETYVRTYIHIYIVFSFKFEWIYVQKLHWLVIHGMRWNGYHRSVLVEWPILCWYKYHVIFHSSRSQLTLYLRYNKGIARYPHLSLV